MFPPLSGGLGRPKAYWGKSQQQSLGELPPSPNWVVEGWGQPGSIPQGSTSCDRKHSRNHCGVGPCGFLGGVTA